MSRKLRKLADTHAVIFWGVSVLVFVALWYKTLSVVFLGKTEYVWDEAFLRLAIALSVILMMKEIYKGEFHFNFRTKNMMRGFLLVWPAYLLIGYNVLGNMDSGRIYAETFFMVLVNNMIIGFFEEVVVRGFLAGHMMMHWRGDKRRIWKSVLISAAIFGVFHLGNLVKGDTVQTLVQVGYTTAIGILFGAVYLRIKNFWTLVIIHGLIDFFGSFSEVFHEPQIAGPPSDLSGIPWLLIVEAAMPLIVLSILCVAAAVFLLRKKKTEEVLAAWDCDR